MGVYNTFAANAGRTGLPLQPVLGDRTGAEPLRSLFCKTKKKKAENLLRWGGGQKAEKTQLLFGLTTHTESGKCSVPQSLHLCVHSQPGSLLMGRISLMPLHPLQSTLIAAGVSGQTAPLQSAQARSLFFVNSDPPGGWVFAHLHMLLVEVL